MTKRNSSNSDNELIDEAGDLPTPGQGGRSGGDLARRVGTRSELHNAYGSTAAVERVTGSDDPDADAVKGPKTRTQYRKRR